MAEITDEMVRAAYAAYESDDVIQKSEDWMRTILETALAAGVGVTEPAWKVSDDRIKRLMIDVGMPNSMSLYQSFKQLENELALTATWRCRVREAGKTDPPQDCNWPFCGCDPYAIKVMDAIEESGIPVSCKCLSPARAGSKPEGDG